MHNFFYLLKTIVMRIVLALVVVAVLYNPWFSLYQVIIPSNFTLLDMQQGWLYKLIGVLLTAGALLLFVRTTRQSMGNLGVGFMLMVLGLIAYIPFYAGWLALTRSNVGFVAYFGILPVLLGVGLATGYITRYLNGTLITKPTVPGHDVHHDGHGIDHVDHAHG